MSSDAAGLAPDAPARGGGQLRRLLGPVRVRLAGLVFIAAVPLLLLSGAIAWQNYQLALLASADRVGGLREQAVARHDLALGGAEQMMQALSQASDLTSANPAMCRTRLAGVLALQRSRYSNLAIFDAAGTLRCSAIDLPPSLPATALARSSRPIFEAAAQSHGLALGAVILSPLVNGPVIPAAYPVLQDGRVAGFLLLGIRVDWFRSNDRRLVPDLKAVWLADPAGVLTQVAETGQRGLPNAPLLRTLLDTPSVLQGLSAGGAPYAYATAAVGGGWRLIVAYPASADRLAARRVLIKRLAQLGVLLLLGLTAVAVGAHIGVVEPLDQLSRAVARWQRGGGFDARALDDPPTEVRDLAVSFGKAAHALAEHEVRQREAAEQQELLMREIHHRVKNNLQIVASLLNLQASRIRQPEARAEFVSARDRVRALATLHRHLYSQGEVQSINMRSFLTELCGQLFQAMGEREGQRIKLGIEASALRMSSDQAVPLALIVTEAVSNALKYAFPHGREGHVDVSLTSEGDTAELVIRDDGVGIPSGRAETDMGPRDGIGLTLIRGFAKQLGADLSVEEGCGTRYRLRMTLRRSGHDDIGGAFEQAVSDG